MSDTGTVTVRGPQMTTTKDGRYYLWKGDRYWSVTTIIKGGLPAPVLMKWGIKMVAEGAADLADELPGLVAKNRDAAVRMLKDLPYANRDRKADLGSLVHEAAEAYVLGRPYPTYTPEQAPYMVGFRRWLDDFRPEFEAVEAPTFSKSQRYAGTLDAIAKIGNLRLLIDYKSGKGVYPEVGLQLAAYRYSESFIGLPDASEEPTPAVDGCAVLHLKPEAYSFVDVRADEEVFRSFLYVREVFRFRQEIEDTILRAEFNPPTEPTLEAVE